MGRRRHFYGLNHLHYLAACRLARHSSLVTRHLSLLLTAAPALSTAASFLLLTRGRGRASGSTTGKIPSSSQRIPCPESPNADIPKRCLPHLARNVRTLIPHAPVSRGRITPHKRRRGSNHSKGYCFTAANTASPVKVMRRLAAAAPVPQPTRTPGAMPYCFTSSTRRFLARPSSLSFDATGA
jgi:hypothetical protein